MVTYIDNPTEERFEQIKDMGKGIDLERLESPTEIPYEEGEDYKKRLLETLLEHFFYATDTPEEKRCKALLEIITFLVRCRECSRTPDSCSSWCNANSVFGTIHFCT